MSQTNLLEAFKQKAVRFALTRIPSRMKRSVHIASLGAYIKGSTSLDSATMDKLNALMALGMRPDALKLPVALSKVIWDGKVQNYDLAKEAMLPSSPEVVSQIATLVINDTPAWLRYAEEGRIRTDVEKLFSIFRIHTEAKPAA